MPQSIDFLLLVFLLNFLNNFEFTMDDNISVMDQVHELQVLVNKLRDLKVEVSEPLQVEAINHNC
jgi:hypothetical protein